MSPRILNVYRSPRILKILTGVSLVSFISLVSLVSLNSYIYLVSYAPPKNHAYGFPSHQIFSRTLAVKAMAHRTQVPKESIAYRVPLTPRTREFTRLKATTTHHFTTRTERALA
jgi:hypothetical protein